MNYKFKIIRRRSYKLRLAPGNAFGVILYYDMVQDISQAQEQGFEKLVQKGIGLIFFYIIPLFLTWIGTTTKIPLGGRYHEKGPKASNFTHEVDLTRS